MKKEFSEVTINGKPSKIFKNKSIGERWSIEHSNIDTIKIIEALLNHYESSFKFDKGITIISPKTTIDLVSECNCTRPSNHIGIIRNEVGSNTLITYFTGSKSYYGVMKSDINIKKLIDLKTRVAAVIEKRNDIHGHN